MLLQKRRGQLSATAGSSVICWCILFFSYILDSSKVFIMCLDTLVMPLKHRDFFSVHYLDNRSWKSEQCYLVSAPLWQTEDAGEEKKLCKPVVKCSNQCNQFFQVHFLLRILFCTDYDPFTGCNGLWGKPLNSHELVALVILYMLMDNIH